MGSIFFGTPDLSYNWEGAGARRTNVFNGMGQNILLIAHATKGHSYGRVFFFSNFRLFFRAISQTSNFSCFSCFFFSCMNLNELDFFLQKNFTNSDRTPPCID